MRTARLVSLASINNNDADQKLGDAVRPHGGQALIVQGHALKILQQGTVDLSTWTNLASIGSDLNNAIGKAQGNAKLYLNVIQPKMITTIGNISAYFDLQNALPTALDPNTDRKTAVGLLNAVLDQVNKFKSDAGAVVLDLQNLRTGLSADAANFGNIVQRLNAAVSGDNGVLSSIEDQLGSIDQKIAGAITGVVLSGLAIAGGIFVICVGAIAGFVTAGTSTPLVLLGVGIVAAGVGGEVGSSIALANLINLKADLLRQKSTLTAEVNFATGLNSTFQDFATSSSNAAQAAQEMANAWSFLADDLKTLITNVEKGNTDVASLRALFLAAAKGTVTRIQGDIATIKGQLEGATTVKMDPSKGDKSIADTVVRVAQEHEKAAA